jgi:hypothetical protein
MQDGKIEIHTIHTKINGGYCCHRHAVLCGARGLASGGLCSVSQEAVVAAATATVVSGWKKSSQAFAILLADHYCWYSEHIRQILLAYS